MIHSPVPQSAEPIHPDLDWWSVVGDTPSAGWNAEPAQQGRRAEPPAEDDIAALLTPDHLPADAHWL